MEVVGEWPVDCAGKDPKNSSTVRSGRLQPTLTTVGRRVDIHLNRESYK